MPTLLRTIFLLCVRFSYKTHIWILLFNARKRADLFMSLIIYVTIGLSLGPLETAGCSTGPSRGVH